MEGGPPKISIDMYETPHSLEVVYEERFYMLRFGLDSYSLRKGKNCSKCSSPLPVAVINIVTHVYYEIELRSSSDPRILMETLPADSDLGKKLIRIAQIRYQKIYCEECGGSEGRHGSRS